MKTIIWQCTLSCFWVLLPSNLLHRRKSKSGSFLLSCVEQTCFVKSFSRFLSNLKRSAKNLVLKIFQRNKILLHYSNCIRTVRIIIDSQLPEVKNLITWFVYRFDISCSIHWQKEFMKQVSSSEPRAMSRSWWFFTLENASLSSNVFWFYYKL